MKYFKLFPLLLVTATLSFLICSCRCPCEGKETPNVPMDVLNNANTFIISKTGEAFFNDYITPDFSLTKHADPNYEMVYRLYIPEKPYVNTKITFTVDGKGMVVKDKDIIGIPECTNTPTACNWQINEEAAIQIAKDNELEDGVKDWKVKFVWNPERNMYVWHILTTIREFEGDFGYRGNGKEMLIDPVSGDVLNVTGWQIQ
ncbi:MAG: PepSY domain-containing protein [Ignavibacteria bacterium]